MQVKQLVIYGVCGSIVLAIATGGKEGLQSVQAGLDKSNQYAQAQDNNKTSIDNAKQESKLAWQMVNQELCTPAVGLTPKVNEWAFVSVPLKVGDIATIGGKREQPFAPGALLCVEGTGQVGRVGLGGRIENPIIGSQTPNWLPVVPAEKREQFAQTIAALRQRPNSPQAVVSSLQELQERRVQIHAQNPVAPPAKQPQVSPPSQPVQQPESEKGKIAQTQSYPTFSQTEVVENLPKVKIN